MQQAKTAISLAAGLWSGALALTIMMQPWVTDNNSELETHQAVGGSINADSIVVPYPNAHGTRPGQSDRHLLVDMTVNLEDSKDWPLAISLDTVLRDFLLHVVQDAQMQKQIAPDQPQLSAMMNAKARSEKWWPQNALISIKRIEIVIPR